MFENGYRRLTPEEHPEMHRRRKEREGKEAQDLRADLQAICKRRHMSEFVLELNRSAAEYLREFASDQRPDRVGSRA